VQIAQPVPIPAEVVRALRVIRRFDPKMTYGALATEFGDAPCNWSVRYRVDYRVRRMVLDEKANVISNAVVAKIKEDA
jgi:hypothetical protein